MKPLIGITMNLEVQPTRNLNVLDQDYGRAVLRAGGLPVPILGIDESIPDLVKQLDGFVFSGGDDIHPRFYKEKPLRGACMTNSPDGRTQFELDLFKAVVKAKKPMLAICCGAQLANIALGGTLYQDIALQVPDPIEHRPKQRGERTFHDVDVLEKTMLSRIIGASKIRVRSAHHQSVKKTGRGLHVSAVARDGVIEALEPKREQFFIAVQWHPEKTLDDRYTKKLFKTLINASKK